ncbi:fungal-specific transcription factor domain-containing protein [Mycena metata]|uniref:Fungal-specific transcription factor domain-containing protein n=1 Tax=Mycena metata TaxID=1033252 RepID=A0AAD7NZ47_9AGAR|nr:fungal-specific transcription factor domain-containing protein [Mycena metata]
MPDESSPSTSSTSPAAPRPKPPKTSSTGTVRGRTSPAPGSTADQNGDGPRPTKRARKAINCEPCRNSKLKCDRNRPCSSCVLRGTSAMCYQDSRGHDGGEYAVRGDDHQRIDPAQEIARLRHSISLLEAYVFPTQRPYTVPRRNEPSPIVPKKEVIDPDISEKLHPPTAPGMLGSQIQGGLYAGPTSAALHLMQADSRGSEDSESRRASEDRNSDVDLVAMSHEYDRDLLAVLPSVDIIDGLISYYFEYCNWIYRHVNQVSFTQNWERYKNGSSPDRTVLATACAIMASATYYLPAQHRLLEGYPETHEELGLKYFEVSTTALHRRQADTKTYSLDLIELLLIRCHYLITSKRDSEEIWHAKGEIVTIGTAMGLHRDPGKWRMPRDIAERRRWAWWHIVLLERWQAFMFGRPITISSHHFDTQLPSYCDPSVDKTGRLYLPNIALFRLAFILGDIMDDAVSVRPVPYDSVQANDRALTQWMENLPSELDLDEYRLARNLASSNLSTRRLGVQSVIIRESYYHIRFTLHRPYASAASSSKLSVGDVPSKSAQSLEIAVNAADNQRPDFLTNSAFAVPGHMNWGPFHCFSAAMFFSFQLIANPDQPGANLFRSSIRKAMQTLEHSRGNAVADKGYDILQSLAPLYSAEFPVQSEKAKILGVVRKLAFPYHDSHDPRRAGESPSARGAASSPSNSNSVSPPMNMAHALPHYDGMHQNLSSVRTNAPAPNSMYTHNPQSPDRAHGIGSPTVMSHPHSLSGMSGSSPGGYNPPYQLPPPPAQEAVWGAAIGFGHGEWTQFLDVLRPEQAPSNGGRHAPGP